MTAKIDRFQIDEGYSPNEKGVIIHDFLTNTSICGVKTDNKDLNIQLAKLILDALNEEFEEDD